MSDYQFTAEQISQHVVKLAVDFAPVVNLEQNRPALQNFANAMISRFPDLFETLVSGPQQFRVNKTFHMGSGQADVMTLAWAQRGLVLSIPKRLFVSGSHDVAGPDADTVFKVAVEELNERFPDRGMPRATSIHNLVFDTGEVNSMDLIAGNFTKPQWQNGLKNTRIQLQSERDNKAILHDIRPTYVSPGGRSEWPAPDDARFGVVVNVEVAVRQAPQMLSTEDISNLLAFSSYYVPGELLGFLNG